MHVADIYDYQFFPNRSIEGRELASQFESKSKEQFIESLFEKRLGVSGFNSFDDWVSGSETTSLIVIQKDEIIYEKYFNGFTRDSYFHSQSMAKSFISFLIGVAIDEGLIKSIDDSIVKYIPSLAERDIQFRNITIRHLLEMKSGLRYTTHYIPFTNIHSPWHDEAVGYYHNDLRSRLLNDIEVENAPGELFEYNNYNTSFLGMIIENATGKSVSNYLEEKLWQQVMEYSALFSLDSRESGFEYMPSRLIARAIDYARFGMLYLNDGQWQGKQLISASWVNQSVSEISNSSPEIYPDWFNSYNCERTYYSLHWWGHINCDGTKQFFATGNLGQNIYVIPDLQIVIVHTGNSLKYYGDQDMWHIAKLLRKNLNSKNIDKLN
tara:strand:+ start:72486 stop:73625 length:1140 start_codon:yes stop_codon:yes gene_type:complete